MRGKIKERFEAKYIPEPNSGCWLWTAGAIKGGYGRIVGDDKKLYLAHRVAYEIYNGQIPDGLQVLHRCDIPACVNPEHLFVGTVTDNMQDMKRKGRGKSPQRGIKHHFAKLNPEKAFEIRWLAASVNSWNELAREYGVSKYNIQCVVKNRTWKPEIHD